MSTGDKFVNIYLKKFLPQNQMQDNFQLILQKFTEDLYTRIFPESGVFRGGVLSSSAVDTFDVSTPLEASNSQGKDLVFDPSLGTQVPFENTLSDLYFVGLQISNIPADVEINVRTGKIKYVFVEEAIGERADPDLVVDDGDGTMTIRVNSVTETAVDNTGRTVKVFLKATEDGGAVGPQTLITPFEDLVVQYDGVNNFIETTTGLGQSATSISTDANDYEVVLSGPSVKKNTDLRLIAEVIFLGIITGTGAGTSPTVFDQADRRVLGSGSGGGGSAPQIFAVLETDGVITHSESTVGQVSWSTDLYYRPFGNAGETNVIASNVTLADDEVAYLQVPDPYVGGTDVLQISPRSSTGLQSPDRYWIFHRDGNFIKVRGGMQLEQGEARQLDDIMIGGVLNFGADDKIRYDDTTNIFHFDADAGTDNANLAIGSDVNFGDPTNNDKLAYSAGLLSVLLNNAVTGSAVSAGRFASQRALAADTAFEALVTADVVSRYLVQADGKIEWSTGAVAADTDLFRSGVGILETTNILRSAIGTLRLNDVDITRDSATLISIAANLQITSLSLFMGPTANNDFIRFVEGGNPFFEFLTNNVQRMRIDEAGLLTVAGNITTTGGRVTFQDVILERESATRLGLIGDLRISTGILRAAAFANNDFMRFVEGGTPIWEFLTNNVRRWKVDELGDATSTRDTLTESGTAYAKPSDASAITGVNASLNEVYDRTKARNLLKVTANNVADKAINVAGARLSITSTEEIGLINSNTEVVSFAGATVDFGTGVVSVGDNITPFTPSLAVRFFKYGILLNAENEIVIVEPTTDFASRAASDADTTEPLLDGGIPIGVITVESISTTPGDIQTIIEEDILFFGASGSGGGGSATDFRIKKISGTTATIDKGEQKLMSGHMLIAGVGTTQAVLPAEFAIDLTTILGSGPAASTAYWLVIDKESVEEPFTLTDNDRPVIRINGNSDFKILLTDPLNTNSFRYLPVGRIFSASDSTWDGAGSSFGTTPVVRESFDGKFFSQVEENSDTVIAAAGSNVFVHGLSGKAQIVEFFYNDGVTETMVPNFDHLVDNTETQVEYSSFGLTFGGGETLTCRAVRIQKPAGNIGSLQTDKNFGPYSDTATTTVPHGLGSAQDIRGMVLIEHDVTADRYRVRDNDLLVTDYDDTTIYLDWLGLTPTPTLTYTLVMGGAPLPASIPVSIGGFTKFVGFGPGSYATLTEALAASVAGDSILIQRSYSITVQEVIALSDIRIRLMPGVKITVTAAIATAAWLVTGDRVDMQGLNMEVGFAGAQDAGLRIESDDCNITEMRITANDAGLTLTDAIHLTAATERNYANASVRAIAGTITNTITETGTDNSYSVRG